MQILCENIFCKKACKRQKSYKHIINCHCHSFASIICNFMKYDANNKALTLVSANWPRFLFNILPPKLNIDSEAAAEDWIINMDLAILLKFVNNFL